VSASASQVLEETKAQGSFENMRELEAPSQLDVLGVSAEEVASMSQVLEETEGFERALRAAMDRGPLLDGEFDDLLGIINEHIASDDFDVGTALIMISPLLVPIAEPISGGNEE